MYYCDLGKIRYGIDSRKIISNEKYIAISFNPRANLSLKKKLKKFVLMAELYLFDTIRNRESTNNRANKKKSEVKGPECNIYIKLVK